MTTSSLASHAGSDPVPPVPDLGGRRLFTAAALAGVAATGWLGLRLQPTPLPSLPVSPGPVPTVPLPRGLPPPVERFHRTIHGDRVPVIDSAMISGRGTMRVAGIRFPARFRFCHVTGEAYRHEIELTFFRARIAAVDERFVDGHARLELPCGVSEGPAVDQGANLALWAEAVWMPSVWITDPRARWEPADANSARLVVPFGDRHETLTVRFDPGTGLLARIDSQRFRALDDATTTGWINRIPAWGRVHHRPVPLRATVAWSGEAGPWADLRTEQVTYNADLAAHVRAGAR